MDERPSFRRRADVRELFVALAVPWVLIGVAYSVPLLDRELHRAGYDTGWMGYAPLIWFYSFGFPAILVIPLFFLFGVWRLATRWEYRRSWCGWVWLVAMWINVCALTSVAH